MNHVTVRSIRETTEKRTRTGTTQQGDKTVYRRNFLFPEAERTLKVSHIDPYLIYEQAMLQKVETKISRIDFVKVEMLKLQYRFIPPKVPILLSLLTDKLQVGANIYTDTEPDITVRYDHLVIEPIESKPDCEKD